jgi:dolichol-phosphate mannosyltransferase
VTRPDLNIVIPVFNEGANFRRLWCELDGKVHVPFRAIVVYDFAADDTVPAVEAVIAAGESRIALIRNQFGAGVVNAIRTGFAQVADGPVLVVMADLSDDLEKVDRMYEIYRSGFDVVAGSRYMRGGKLVGGPFFKQLLSRLAGVSLAWLRRLPTHDATNAFKIYDARMVNSFVIESRGGFELNLELTVKAFLGGYRIAELPVVWRDRTAGESHFRLWKWLPLYLRWYFYAFRPRRRRNLRAANTAGVRHADVA